MGASCGKIKLPDEVFEMLNQMLETNIVIACKSIDTFLEKNIPAVQAQRLNALKTNAFNKALLTPVPAPVEEQL